MCMTIAFATRRMRTIVLGCLTGLCISGTTFAQISNDKVHVDIPAQSLSSALTQFGRDTGTEIVFTPDAVNQKTSTAIKGDFAREKAISLLLGGTGLTYRVTAQGAIVINGSSAPDKRKEQTSATAAPATGMRVAQSAAGEQETVPKSGESTDVDQKSKKNPGLEEIVVTGSRIPQTAKAGGEPVRIYTKEQIESSGQTSVSDFLNTLPDVSILASPALYGNGGVNASSTVQLHGLPIGTTLVLLNGRRVETGAGPSFDLGNLPLSAIQRIDVLPVGASAIYGSDALAGAVNIILRNDINGLEVNAKYGHANGTDEKDANIGFGHHWNHADATFIANYQGVSELIGAERTVTSSFAPPPPGSPDLRVDYCAPGNVYSLNGQNLPGLSSTFAAIQSGITGTPTLQNFAGGMLNKCTSVLGDAIIPATQKVQALASGHYELSDALDVFTEVMFSHEDLHVPNGNLIFAPAGRRGFLQLGANSPFNPFGENVGVSFQNNALQGNYENIQQFIRPLIGIRGALPADWHYEVTAMQSRDYSNVNENYNNYAALRTALSSSDPATAINPFTTGAAGSQQALQSLIDASNANLQNFRTSQELTSGQAILSGPLLKLRSGPIQSVFGAEYDVIKAKVVAPDTGTANYRRNSYALFTEQRIPILSNHDHPDAGDRLAVAGAFRFDSSNDFGNKTTGQGTVEWRPSETILFRGGYATSYKAPQPSQISGGQAIYPNQTATDPFRPGEIATFTGIYGPNPNLKAETGQSRTWGIVYSSKELPGLDASISYFGVDISNYIGTPGTQDIINNPNVFPGAVTRGPPSQQDIQMGYPGPITQVATIDYNFGNLNVAGVNFDASYRAPTDFGQLTPSISLTDTYKYNSALAPGQPQTSYVSQATFTGPGFAPRLKGTVAMGWKLGPYSASADGRYIGRYKDYQDFGASSLELGNFWIYDINIRYAIGKAFAPSSTLAHGAYLEVGAINILNQLPQHASRPEGFDPLEADPRGRVIYVRIGGKW
jgi:iron complex outermembrane recepter protein